ncbi:hypothetical protein MRB53_038585 [Persea americana]|nr:hypothetical protein MRB53_038585 [Persea americana]
MAYPPSGPGKTAPRLILDLLAFDPVKANSFHVLPQHPPQLGQQSFVPKSDACKHDFTIKQNQSLLPPLDTRPNQQSFYKIAILCKKCRLHANIAINYGESQDPCPTSECPLHHFQRSTSHDISDGNITSKLKQRYEDILQQDPGREGIKQATPVDALARLRRYIGDALKPDHQKRTFPSNNKQADATWTLPQIHASKDGDYSLAHDLQDVDAELFVLVERYSKDLNLNNPMASESWPSAIKELERTLSSQGYPRHPAARRTIATAELGSYCASLGAVSDFADSLIAFCYDRQALCDVEEQSYYFDCLREIATSRNSEELDMKATMLMSQGIVSRRDLVEAYTFFNLPLGGGAADDERIMNLYQAQSGDLGPEASEKARNMLLRIGNARGSQLLINAAQQTIETVQEALAWLGNGIHENTPDDMVITVFAIKTDNDPAKEEIGRKAVSVIAKARQSSQLNTWLETGRTDGYTMDINEALRHLDITESIDGVDPTLWPSIFENARMSRPGEQTNRAIAAIEQALKGGATSHTAAEWPVGLTSLGNTCYLNSLLQYYFSLKPLRDIVLNYDEFKFDVGSAAEKAERVGQRQISALEIKGGQKFAEDLRQLFNHMIHDPSTAVKPEQDLEDATETKQEVSNTISEATTAVPDDAMQIDESQNASMMDLPPTPPASPGSKAVDVNGKPPPLPPRRFSTTTNAALERAQSNATQQQDVTEVHDGIQFRLRAGMRPQGRNDSGEQIDELLQLFAIQLLDTPVKDSKALKPQQLMDSAIQLNVLNEPTDIYSALDAIFDLQTVDGSDNLERYKSIASLPPFLQINIPRVGFNKEKGEQFKSEHSIKLVDELYLDRYFSQADNGLLERRANAWNWRRSLADLKREHNRLKDSASGLDGQLLLQKAPNSCTGSRMSTKV